MERGLRLSLLALAALGCERPRGDSAQSAGAASSVAVAAPAASSLALLDSVVVQDLADWPSLAAHLPASPESAAAVLERYRQAHGLPLEFFVRPDAPKSLLASVRTQQEEMCGGDYATAFVRRMPRTHAVLHVSEVAELDSAGRELRRWPLPRDIEFFELVAGVHGDELVTLYQPRRRDGIYLRVRPDGEFRVSAEPPQPLPPEKWIEVEDSVFLRVEPRDAGPFYTYPSGATPAPVGTWEPTGDSDLYVRTDSGPKRGTVAHAVTRKDWSPSPRSIACPPGPEYEGMICRGFPDGAAERRIAAPTPCS